MSNYFSKFRLEMIHFLHSKLLRFQLIMTIERKEIQFKLVIRMNEK